jgi:hypothetical protein
VAYFCRFGLLGAIGFSDGYIFGIGHQVGAS